MRLDRVMSWLSDTWLLRQYIHWIRKGVDHVSENAFVSKVFDTIESWHFQCKQKVLLWHMRAIERLVESHASIIIAWHKDQLYRHDIAYRVRSLTTTLIQKREVARRAGIGPLDPRYPDLFDIDRDTAD